MKNRNQTNKILMQDEQVLLTLKPHLAPVVIAIIFGFLGVLVFFGSFFLLTTLISGEHTPEEFKQMQALMQGGLLLVIGGIFLFILIIQILAHRNRYYTVTSKRFIIQKGLLGIDYSSIPLSAVQYISVNVSFIDKLLKKGTGSITFGTTSTPVVNSSQGGKFIFANIDDVYEHYRKFKELVDQNQKSEPK